MTLTADVSRRWNRPTSRGIPWSWCPSMGGLAERSSLHAAVRPEVRQIVQGLRDRGVKHIAIISGDHEAPTRKLAESLDMDRYFAQVLPADKADYVMKLQNEGRKVCFVGDGINDSIALKQANVSISLRGASSIATDTAHIVFLEEGLSKLCDLRDIARRPGSERPAKLAVDPGPEHCCVLPGFSRSGLESWHRSSPITLRLWQHLLMGCCRCGRLPRSRLKSDTSWS